MLYHRLTRQELHREEHQRGRHQEHLQHQPVRLEQQLDIWIGMVVQSTVVVVGHIVKEVVGTPIADGAIRKPMIAFVESHIVVEKAMDNHHIHPVVEATAEKRRAVAEGTPKDNRIEVVEGKKMIVDD